MSRRTRLIITTLFLVLLAIPAVYVTLTWSPRDPLRVRALPGVAHGASFVGIARHEVAVENASHIPLRVYELHGDTPPQPRSPNIYQRLPRMMRLDVWERGCTPIPSNGTGHMELFVENFTPESEPPGQILCVYASVSKDLVMRFLNRCYLHSPASLRRFIPEVQPEFYYGPLEHAP